MKIETGSTVEVEYTIYDSEGNAVESSDDEPIEYVHGEGEILPGLEDALAGHAAGDEVTVTLACADAFGEHNPDGIVSIPRDNLPEGTELSPGDFITLTSEPEDGEGDEVADEFELRVIEVNDDAVMADANHPLAGQDVRFEVRVLTVK